MWHAGSGSWTMGSPVDKLSTGSPHIVVRATKAVSGIEGGANQPVTDSGGKMVGGNKASTVRQAFWIA
jgi:hypothetical protein